MSQGTGVPPLQGWRRIGLLVPSSNTVIEVDLGRRLPTGATLHTARMFMEDTTVEGESRMLDEFTIPAAEAIATVRPDIVIFGCTSAGALRGNEFDDELVDRISKVTDARALSVIRSVREAIDLRGGGRIGVITPYNEALNEKIQTSLEADGLEVVGVTGLGLEENFTIAEVAPDQIVEQAVRSYRNKDIDILFASCTNYRAFDALEGIQAAMGVPVVTSNQATLEAVERALQELD